MKATIQFKTWSLLLCWLIGASVFGQTEYHHIFSGTISNYPKTNKQEEGQLRSTCGTQLLFRNTFGRCNNLANANWGATEIPLLRELSSEYGATDPLNALGGTTRPNPRVISNLIVQQGNTPPSATLSSFVFSWGQFLDHDIGITPENEMESAYISETGAPGDLITNMLSFHRSEVVEGSGVNTPREQVNLITAWIDGSNVYGADQIRATWLRTGNGGRLKTSAGNLLPYNTTDGELNSPINEDAPFMAGENPDTPVFVAGDVRANEQSSLTALHTLFVREHNRLCDEIITANNYDPMFDDETIYRIAKKRVVALLQSITYNEFLPALGVNLTAYTGYDNTVQPDLFNGFSTAAFRLGHTMVPPELLLVNDNGSLVASGRVSLIQAFFNPSLTAANGIDPVLKGLSVQYQEEIDIKIVEELRTFLFAPVGGTGFDLASFNIQRGRDHGLADYNAYRNAFTGSSAVSFADITSDATLEANLATLYGNVDDIDLWVGLLSEDKLPGSQIGLTLHNMLAEQFRRLRDGDYYFYLNDPVLMSDIMEIENTSLSDIIERNTGLTTLQENVFEAVCDIVAGNCNCRQSDSLALVELYYATNGAQWSDPWELFWPMTTWEGVSLNPNGCVKVLNLRNRGLSGTLPAAIGDLEYMTFLDLSENNLSGVIPDEIGGLSSIGIINLGTNSLSGEISVSFGNLPGLTVLYLNNNNLTGGLPIELTNAANLGALYTHDNLLSGCYEEGLSVLCNQLSSNFNTSANISAGNGFNATWESFCLNGASDCSGAVNPGDFNNDCVVDQTDEIFWGEAVTYTGSPRLNATSEWIPQMATDWSQNVEGINSKHQDGDGNGVVDFDDLDVWLSNYNEVCSSTMPSSFVLASTLFYYQLELISEVGNIYQYGLHVRDFEGNPVYAHGVSCVFNLENTPITSITMDTTGSSLAPHHAFSLYHSDNNTLYVALTRIDGNNQFCDGAIATFTIVLDNSFDGDFSISVGDGSRIEIDNDYSMGAGTTVYDEYNEFVLSGGGPELNATTIHAQCNTLGLASVEVSGGTPPYSYKWNTGETTSSITELTPDIYEVTVTDNNDLEASVAVQVLGQYIELFDASGNPLPCNNNPCPTLIMPTGNIPDGNYQAETCVNADGAVNAGTSVEFSAGEMIMLNPGFSVEVGAEFSIDTESCNNEEN